MKEYRFNSEQHIHEICINGEWKPLIGTSSMSSVLSKPLTWWASGLAVEKFGWINKGNQKTGFVEKSKRLTVAKARREEIATMTDEEYLNLLDDAYAAHSKKLDSSAKEGTDMHALMEKYVKLCIEKYGGKPIKASTKDSKLAILVQWSVKNVKKFLWSEVHCYSKELWLGGISDVGFEDISGNVAILDFKSSKDAYLSQFWQCVGYAIQLEENGGFTPDGDKILTLPRMVSYVCILPFGMDKPEVQYYFDMAGGKEAVSAMVLLYKKLNN